MIHSLGVAQFRCEETTYFLAVDIKSMSSSFRRRWLGSYNTEISNYA